MVVELGVAHQGVATLVVAEEAGEAVGGMAKATKHLDKENSLLGPVDNAAMRV